jgi:hypothetical protein
MVAISRASRRPFLGGGAALSRRRLRPPSCLSIAGILHLVGRALHPARTASSWQARCRYCDHRSNKSGKTKALASRCLV